MTYKLLALLTFVISLGCTQMGMAQDTASQFTGSQLKALRHSAHTSAQYEQLAAYYDGQQKKYAKLASTTHAEWVRRTQNTDSLAAKYPQPATAARNLYEYYAGRADEAAMLSAKYRLLANPSASN